MCNLEHKVFRTKRMNPQALHKAHLSCPYASLRITRRHQTFAEHTHLQQFDVVQVPALVRGDEGCHCSGLGVGGHWV